MAEPKLNHHTEMAGGVLTTECGAVLSAFFSARRKKHLKKTYKKNPLAAGFFY